MFSIFDTASTDLQLSVLEALYIRTYQPAFSKQKDFIISFHLNLLTLLQLNQTKAKKITNSSW